VAAVPTAYLVFGLGGGLGGEAASRYALPLDVVREIRRPAQITPVPGTAPFVLGVSNLRGVVLAVVDLGVGLGVTEAPYRQAEDAAASRLIVVHHDGLDVACAVAAVEGVARPAELLAPLEGTLAGVRRHCVATLRDASGLVAVLDPGFVRSLRQHLEASA
jgi:chemotaxis signal transduction protein